VTNVTFSFETSPNETLREKCGEDVAYYAPPVYTIGGDTFPVSPTKLRPRQYLHRAVRGAWNALLMSLSRLQPSPSAVLWTSKPYLKSLEMDPHAPCINIYREKRVIKILVQYELQYWWLKRSA